MDRNQTLRFPIMLMGMVALILSTLACGLGGTVTPSIPAATVSVNTNVDISKIDICSAIPTSEITNVLGRNLVGNPAPFHFNDAGTDSGCNYNAGKDGAGNAYFAYLVIAPEADYQTNKLHGSAVTPVSGLGDEAYTTNGADAMQLWVLLKGKAAVMVAIGDVPNLNGAKKIAPLLISLVP